jgi:hypothetical protein
MTDDQVRRVHVPSHQQAQIERTRLMSQGYAPVSEDIRGGQTVIVLWRKKQFNGLAFGLGLLVWLLPGVIYLLIYMSRGDDLVELWVEENKENKSLESPEGNEGRAPETQEAETLPSLPPTVLLSPDRQQWWDGSEWRDLQDSIPPEVQRSPDARSWWDGQEWRPVPSVAV